MTGLLPKYAERHAALLRVLIANILIATSVCAWAQDIDTGQTEFLSRCAECHGTDGKGAGPTSSKLKFKPTDLTVLAKRNNGLFSRDAIVETVDGRRAIKHHHGEMPIWGCQQGPPPGPQRKAYKPKPIDSLLDIPCDPEEVARKRILDIVEYLGQIQEK